MAPGKWDQIRELFNRALDLPTTERAAFLSAECADANIRAEVETLLSGADAHILGSRGIEGVWEAIEALGPDKGVSTASITDETGGRVIGRYRLLQKIGEGGMGEVWLAEQREPVRRRVALKLTKAGMNTREVMARFESERQALALMDHPAIAKVFDAGATDRGSPYFVMEYVAGVPITAYCDNHRLSTRERLALFMGVCEGVQHAHQKAIIHRDLKPSNILVTEVDGRAAPKIIDFGVAKALAQRLTAETVFTRAGALVGTPEYMSPEQATSSGEDVDTRTDVYSLGVIFYELLAGAPPLELRKIAFDELLRRLREEEPPKPSTKIQTQDPVTAEEMARKRHAEPLGLANEIRGDLDSIALKALEKDRSRRYASASDLADDVGRYLRNEAVLAMPPSVRYRARKFAWRYRVALATVVTFVVVLIVATVVTVQRIWRADMYTETAQVTKLVAQDPLSLALLMDLGAINQRQGNYELAETEAAEVLAQRRNSLGSDNPDTMAAAADLALAYLSQGKFLESETLAREVLEFNRKGQLDDWRRFRAESLLGVTLARQKRYAEAESLLVEGYQGMLARKERMDVVEWYHLNLAREWLVQLYQEWSKSGQAAKWRTK